MSVPKIGKVLPGFTSSIKFDFSGSQNLIKKINVFSPAAKQFVHSMRTEGLGGINGGGHQSESAATNL